MKQNDSFNLDIPRMETIRNTAKILGLPEYFVRSKVNSGEVVSVDAGSKKLVNIDKFINYLNTGTTATTIKDETDSATIQKIPKRRKDYEKDIR